MAIRTGELVEAVRGIDGAIDTTTEPTMPGPQIDRPSIDAVEILRIAGARSVDEEPTVEPLDLPAADIQAIDVDQEAVDSSTARRDNIEAQVARHGLEALAWYRSYHWGPYGWGIYLREAGIFHLAADLGRRRGVEPTQCLSLARDVLYGHELFHFLVDVATSALEVAVMSALYVSRSTQVASVAPGYDELEEALANRHARRFVAGHGVDAEVNELLSQGPAGYRDLNLYLDPEPYASGCRELLGRVLSIAATGRPLPLFEALIDEDERLVDRSDVPVWLVRDQPSGAVLRFVTKIDRMTESPQFRRDLRQGGSQLTAAWRSVKRQLSVDATHPGLHFEKLRGTGNSFSVRVDLAIRARLRFERGTGWIAERIGSHDVVYR